MYNIMYYRLIPSCLPPPILCCRRWRPHLDALELTSKLLLDTPLTSLASIATSPLPFPPEPAPSATTGLPRLNTLDSTCSTSRIPCLICCRRLSCSTGTGLALWGTTLKVTLRPNGPFLKKISYCLLEFNLCEKC